MLNLHITKLPLKKSFGLVGLVICSVFLMGAPYEPPPGSRIGTCSGSGGTRSFLKCRGLTEVTPNSTDFYKRGVRLFEASDYEDALISFQRELADATEARDTSRQASAHNRIARKCIEAI